MTIEKRPNKQPCPQCALQGIKSNLHLFQIDDHEAFLMCKNEDCTFLPSASSLNSFIVKRDLSKVTVRTKTNSVFSSSASSLSSFRCFSCTPSEFGLRNLFSSNSTRSSDSENHHWRFAGPLSSKFFQRPSTPSSEVGERKSLVPFDPFLTGHAHNFHSFQTSKIEGLKRTQSNNVVPSNVKRARLENSSNIEEEKNTLNLSTHESLKISSCDSVLPKSNPAKPIAIPSNKLNNLRNNVLKVIVVQDKKQTAELKSNEATKVLDIKPIGFLENIRQDYIRETSYCSTSPKGSRNTCIGDINDKPLSEVYPLKVSSDSNNTLTFSVPPWEVHKEQITQGTEQTGSEQKAQYKKSASISTENHVTDHLDCFAAIREASLTLSELDNFHLSNFEDF
ncbi:hypothetical protein BgiMline_035258 [Biomphalaria glabrata]|nr:Biomphalaria glabrata SUMO-specific isopeptidase USPL1-like; transcript variant X3 [Biomphalaria glabrata]